MKVLKFGAVWCPGCLVMKPRWKEIENENPWLETEYYDFDEHNDAIRRYNISDMLPIFIFLDKHGKEILRLEGEVEKETLVSILAEHKDK